MDRDKTTNKPPAYSALVLVVALVLTLAFLAVAVLHVPIGIRGEWQWKYAQGAGYWNAPIALIASTVFIMGVYVLYRVREKWVLPGVCALCSVLFCAHLSTISLGKYGLFEYTHILQVPGVVGDYFIEAQKIEHGCSFVKSAGGKESQGLAAPVAVKGVKEYLDNFDDYIDRPWDSIGPGSNTRWNVHPPGVSILFYYIHSSVSASSGMRAALYRIAMTFSGPMADAYGAAENMNFSGTPEVASYVAIGLFLVFLTALSMIPAYLLSRELIGGRVAILSASLCAAIPAMFCFSPGPDQFFAMPALFVLYFTYLAFKKNQACCAFGAGLVLYAGLFMSLAFLPIAAIMFLVPFFLLMQQDEPVSYLKANCARDSKLVLWGLAGFFLPLILLLWVGYDTFGTLAVCFENHTEFYRIPRFHRTYWKWLLVNPFEFAAFAGGSISAVFLLAVVAEFSKLAGGLRKRLNPYFAGFVLAFFLLYISGKNSGEAARLWIFLMPMCAVAGLAALRDKITDKPWLAVPLIAFQMIQAIVFRLCFDVWGVAGMIDNRETVNF